MGKGALKTYTTEGLNTEGFTHGFIYVQTVLQEQHTVHDIRNS